MRSGPLRLLADDLTGALDSAAAFGAGVPVYFDRPGADLGAAVSVVATASRDVAPELLPGLLSPSVAWLADATVAFKKVDSLLRGNSLAEVRWLAAAGGFGRVVFAPAFPAQGRYTLGERLAVAPPGAAADAAEPRGPNLREALLAGGWPSGCELVLPEVRSDANLVRVAALPGRPDARTLWCGSAGLAAAMAAQDGCVVWPASDAAPAGTPVWVVGASHQAVARRQWAAAADAFVGAVTVRQGDPQAFDRALAALAHDDPPLALLDLAPPQRLAPAEAAAMLTDRATRLAALPRGPARLLVLGGDTARALARATGVANLVSGQPLRPGWGQARWHGGRWHGLSLDCRSGAFGDDDDLRAAVAAALGPPP